MSDPYQSIDAYADPYAKTASIDGYVVPNGFPKQVVPALMDQRELISDNSDPIHIREQDDPSLKSRPYHLSVETDLFGEVPRFWVSGTGDMRSLAAHTGLEYDPIRQQYRASTPYHARLIWCYADSSANHALQKLFPRFSMPSKPRHVPFVMATNDRIICLTSPDCNDRPRNAGFVYNKKGRFWETRDLRRVMPLIDIAEEDLQRRLQAVSSLPFDMLTDVTISDLVSIPPPEEGLGGG
ncbi:conserved hypothetical protein, partial [Ricinus communis]